MEFVFGAVGLSLLVIVHEGGHYLAARAFGMRVLRFSIGFGPVLFKYQPKGSPTIFQICAIPFLAYVQIDGMSPSEEVDSHDPALYSNKGVLARILTIFAGPFANYLAASLIVFGVVAIGGLQRPDENAPMVVSEVVPGSPAAQAGIQVGDRIVEANGRPIANLAELIAATQDRAGQPTVYIVERNGQRLPPLTIVPQRVEADDGRTRGVIGVSGPYHLAPASLTEAAQIAVLWPVSVSIDTIVAIASRIRQGSTEGLTGPYGMVRMAAQQAERGMRYYVQFIALISVALGLFNLLPFPALDGGRLVFLLFELITRRRANERVEALVHTVGLLVLLSLILVVTFRDVMQG
jgi:regulator of sigma E protease